MLLNVVQLACGNNKFPKLYPRSPLERRGKSIRSFRETYEKQKLPQTTLYNKDINDECNVEKNPYIIQSAESQGASDLSTPRCGGRIRKTPKGSK